MQSISRPHCEAQNVRNSHFSRKPPFGAVIEENAVFHRVSSDLVSKYMKEREVKLGVFEEEESTMAFRAELAAMYDT